MSASVGKELLGKPRLIAVLSLLAAVILCLLLSWLTRDAMTFLPFQKKQTRAHVQETLVDLTPWQTAEQLADMATTAEEQRYAREAEHLADHEVDQAFASALRQAQSKAQHKALQGESLKLSQKVTQLQQSVRDDQAHVQSLSQASTQGSAGTTTSNDDLDFAKAQLGLDSDELADAQEDLARALGDDRARIQQELAAHEANMKKYDSQAGARNPGAVASSRRYGTVVARIGAWFDQRTRFDMIERAAQQADEDAKALAVQHSSMEKQALPEGSGSADRTTRMNAMKSHSLHSQMLAIYDDRIETQSQLGDVYRKWGAQVLLQHRIVFHLLMQSLAMLAFILLCALMVDSVTRSFLDRPTTDRRMYSVRLISRLSIQVITAVLILFVLFGTPREMPTILGLTTAGLTVVLQDFIISFCGWFVLMGKNGIRVGDWVEINGVGGEVVSIGLFRTSLLETGNWTDRGHPTGRRVAFSNSFAIKGQYFNFSTSGQWMWDEITVTVPNSDEAYATVELIHKAVLEETDKESTLAEDEWKRLGRSNSLSQFSAAAAVNMRPSPGGIDIVVRYVTRAASRYKVRNSIYQRVIELLHKPLASHQ